MEKAKRYQHIYNQLQELMPKSHDIDARLCSIVAVLHHKMEKFFWTGFYCLNKGKLIVKTYQGPVACMELKENTGVCWAGINSKKTILVEDVEKFPGHIACDSRSKSEIVVPFYNKNGQITGVLDIDSKELAAFDAIDALWLEKILVLINSDL
jgi:L-methionine (R)-S-oxide reductase